MRSKFILPIAGFCALAGAMCSTAASADPYFHREQSGSWTNVEYNDGSCHYYFSRNGYDNNTTMNKYGDCSHLAIGPDGSAMPIVAVPGVVVAPPYYGAAVPDYGYR
jgi:hypothetical protein